MDSVASNLGLLRFDQDRICEQIERRLHVPSEIHGHHLHAFGSLSLLLPLAAVLDENLSSPDCYVL